jgi:hypothetical protein
MLFADGFWEIKTLSDTVTIVGFVVTLFSIWFSWWLAKRDIEKRIQDAQKQTVDRLVRSLLHPDVAETDKCLQEAREAYRMKRWDRAVDRCEQAKHRIPKFLSLPGLDAEDCEKLVLVIDELRLLIIQLEEVRDGKIRDGKPRTELTNAKIKDLDDLITTLATIEGKLRASGLR